MTAHERFEALMARPAFYFKTSDERQWEIDKDLGLLDVDGIESKDLTDEMKQRWNKHFGVRHFRVV